MLKTVKDQLHVEFHSCPIEAENIREKVVVLARQQPYQHMRFQQTAMEVDQTYLLKKP